MARATRPSATSTVTINDTTPPSVDDNSNQVIEATSAAGATATFGTPNAHDLVDGTFASTCDHLSGASFPLGVTDRYLQRDRRRRQLRFEQLHDRSRGHHPADHRLPCDVNALATSAAGAVVNYTDPSASDLVDGSVAVSCSPDLRQQFPIGTHRRSIAARPTATGNTGHQSAST